MQKAKLRYSLFIIFMLCVTLTLTGCAAGLLPLLNFIKGIGGLMGALGGLIGGTTGAGLQQTGSRLTAVGNLGQQGQNIINQISGLASGTVKPGTATTATTTPAVKPPAAGTPTTGTPSPGTPAPAAGAATGPTVPAAGGAVVAPKPGDDPDRPVAGTVKCKKCGNDTINVSTELCADCLPGQNYNPCQTPGCPNTTFDPSGICSDCRDAEKARLEYEASQQQSNPGGSGDSTDDPQPFIPDP